MKLKKAEAVFALTLFICGMTWAFLAGKGIGEKNCNKEVIEYGTNQ